MPDRPGRPMPDRPMPRRPAPYAADVPAARADETPNRHILRRRGRPSGRRMGRRRPREILVILSVALALAGVSLVIIGVGGQLVAPQPPPAAAGTYALGSADPAATPIGGPGRGADSGTSTDAGGLPVPVRPVGPILPRSVPTYVSIPAIGVNSSLIRLGLNRDRSIQVPPFGPQSRAGWYRYSPAPGQLGPSILLGHVDSAAYGPGVFFKLGALRKGDTVSIRRADGTVAVFAVDAVAEYPKNHFPSQQVYGNLNHAGLRLITCGGTFNTSSGSYESNIVAFASLVSTHKA